MTLQIANNPLEQFEMPSKPLAPKAVVDMNRSRRSGLKRNKPVPYESRFDTHTYLTAPSESAVILRVTNHVTTGLTVLPSSFVDDEAITRLKESMAAASRQTNTNADRTTQRIIVTEDPELAKKRAEIAERERLKQQKKIQASVMRESERANRTFARRGLTRGGAGLTVDDLEEEEEAASGKAKGNRAKARKRAARDDYSDDDDDMPRGRGREDEYDRTDDFLVDTDEEEDEVDGGEEDEDEAIDEGSGEDIRQPKGPSPKRGRAEVDGDGQKDDAAPGPRAKRRRVIDEDEDE
jgi:RNA polymerase-associated protein LEO1